VNRSWFESDRESQGSGADAHGEAVSSRRVQLRRELRGLTYAEQLERVRPPEGRTAAVETAAAWRAQVHRSQFEGASGAVVQHTSDRSSQAGGAYYEEEYRLPNPVPADGALNYYQKRHCDFVLRWPTTPPPEYYLGYGDKYARRFSLEVYPKLSPTGQAWLDRCRVNLQAAIENHLAIDPEAFDQLERSGPPFTDFAYATHADAYLNAGLSTLNPFELARIALTPDVADLITKAGLGQALEVGLRLLPMWVEQGLDAALGEGLTEKLVAVAYEGMKAVGSGIDLVFGLGTADALSHALNLTKEALGKGAQTVASIAYDVAASGVKAVIEKVDALLGEGAAEAGAEAIRAGASRLLDAVQAAWDWFWR
jgi:hypothetical protein